MEKIRIFLSEILHGGIRVQFDARVGVSQVDRQKGLRPGSKTSAFGLSVCQTPPVTPVLGGFAPQLLLARDWLLGPIRRPECGPPQVAALVGIR